MGVDFAASNMHFAPLFVLATLPGVLSQDTYYCPDGWYISDIGDEIECILLGGLGERVTKNDAMAICSFHDAWLVDMDEGRGPQKNNMLKSLISDAEGNGGFGPLFRVAMVIITGVTGPGTTMGQRWNGTTGWKMSQMIGTHKTVSLSLDARMYLEMAPTIGMTGTVMILQGTSAKEREMYYNLYHTLFVEINIKT